MHPWSFSMSWKQPGHACALPSIAHSPSCMSGSNAERSALTDAALRRLRSRGSSADETELSPSVGYSFPTVGRGASGLEATGIHVGLEVGEHAVAAGRGAEGGRAAGAEGRRGVRARQECGSIQEPARWFGSGAAEAVALRS